MRGLRAVGFLALLAAPAAPAAAQEVSISASVDRTVVPLDGQVTLSVAVQGPQMNLPDPELPSLPNFTVYTSAHSQNFTVVGGRVAATNEHSFILTPRFVGKSVIGPIAVTVGGRRFETTPIEVQVVRPQAAAAAPPAASRAPAPGGPPPAGGFGPDVFLTADVDKPKAFVNEQVTLTVRFHTAVSLMGNPQYTAPKLEGFITEDLPPERHGQLRSRGRLYHYSEIKTALFPVRPGKLSIGSAVVRCQVQKELTIDPYAPDFFQKFFSQGLVQSQAQDLRSDPLQVSVAPLPEASKPASFTGAVGEFRVTAGVDKKSAKVGEAVTLSLAVEGQGNLRALGAPKLPDMPGLRVYDTLSSMSLNKKDDVVRGAKEFKTVLVPRASGAQRVPSIPFSFFNPASADYVSAGTVPLDLEVAPAAAGASAPPIGFVGGPRPGAELTAVTEDIRYVKERPGRGGLAGLLALLAAMTWPHAAPLAAFLLATGRAVHLERLLADPAGARFHGAWSSARRRLADADAAARVDAQLAAQRLSEALSGFLADKLGAASSGLSLRQAVDAMRSRFPGVPAARYGELKAAWEDLDMLRFAGKSATPAAAEKLSAFLKSLLGNLEKELRR